MLLYLYLFKLGSIEYYVYAPSKEEAIVQYLEEKELKELPKGVLITRQNF